jgi:hypothetical protein
MELPPPTLQSQTAYYKGNHRYSFRGGEAAEIIGVRMVATKYGERACFMLLYYDGFIDYAPLEDIRNYIIDGTRIQQDPEN